MAYGRHFGVGAPPILVDFSGDWDVHWGYGFLTHGHLSVALFPAAAMRIGHGQLSELQNVQPHRLSTGNLLSTKGIEAHT